MNPIKYNQNRSLNQHPIQTDVQNELQIDNAFRKIMSTPMTDDQRRQGLTELLRNRASLLHHVPINGLKGGVIFFNMKQIGLAPTPLCQAYNKMRVSTISSYEFIGSNIGTVLLDDSAIQHIPKKILEKAGDLSGKQVEFFWTAIDGRPFVNMDRPVNLCTHPWSHPHALHYTKPLFCDDISHDVRMGVFAEIGFQPCRKPGAIAFEGIGPMQVHTHYRADRGNLAYSPDNAHFEVIPNSPFGIFWAVTQKDNRIAFSKMLVIFDYKHPICASLLNSIRDCDDLSTHLKRLEKVDASIQETLTLHDHDFMQAFDKMPPLFQHGIYREAWLLFESPLGVHGDFGKASFRNDPSLNAKFYCSHDQRKQAVANFTHRLKHLLIDSQMDLMLNSQPLQKSGIALKMLRCAELFAGGNAEQEAMAMELFGQFSREEREAVFFAIWELSESPRGNSSFGSETFLSARTESALKAQAFLLAASRQAPAKFDEPLAAAPAPIEVVPPPALEIEEPQQVPHLPPVELPIEQQILGKMMDLAFDEHFIGLSADARKPLVQELFNQLPVQVKNSVYRKVYEYSTDAKKGGDGWGENHVADSLDVLIDALQDVLTA